MRCANRQIGVVFGLLLLVFGTGFSDWYADKALVSETPPEAFAAGAEDKGDPRVEAHLVIDHASVDTTGEFRAGVFFEVDPEWHIYWRNSGESGLSTEVTFEAEGVEFSALNWPAPEPYLDKAGIVATFGYSNTVLLWSDARVTSAKGDIEVNASIDYLACKVECIPGSATLKRTVKVGAAERGPDWELFEAASSEVAQTPGSQDIEVALNVAGGTEAVLGSLSLVCGGCSLEVMAPVERFAFMPDEGRNILWKTQQIKRSGPRSTIELSGTPNPDGFEGSCDLGGVVWVRKDGKPLPLAIEQPLDCASIPELQAAEATEPKPAVKVELSSNTKAPANVPNLNLFYVLLLAFLGGMILNLMPCVFPVLAIKVFSFVKLAHETKSTVLAHSLAYTVGVVGSMLALASVVVGLKVAGTEVGWGFQFQEPLFIVALAAVLVLFALNLFGVFEVSLGIQARKSSEHTLRQSVGEGVLAVVLATPCSAPFLGTAVGFALSASYTTIFLIFGVLGLGLAFPFVVLTLMPGAARVLPKPGNWMVIFKQVLGFALLGTCIWLIWVLGQSVGVNGVTKLLIFLTVLGLGAWGFGHVQFKSGAVKWGVSLGLAALVAATGFVTLSFDPSVETQSATYDSSWENWSHERVAEETQNGRVVFVDFTADWCITCKVNEGAVLAQPKVDAAFEKHRVVKLKGDWTKKDEEIRQVLESFGKGGVPLYLVYGPGINEVKVLPEILSQELVVSALDEAAGK